MSGPGAAEGVQGVEELKATLTSMVPPEIRPPSSKPFLFAIDHCFPIKGQGTVLTGTVLQVGRSTTPASGRGSSTRDAC
jgi:selenocysteine-specific elongation factor